MMEAEAQALNDLMLDEGFSEFPYRCTAGKLTIGFGRNIDEDGGKGIDLDEGRMLLANDVRECSEDLKDVFGADLWVVMPVVRKAALINMRFQLGPYGFRLFEKTIAAVKAGDWGRAADEILDSEYARQTPSRAMRVSNRVRTGKI